MRVHRGAFRRFMLFLGVQRPLFLNIQLQTLKGGSMGLILQEEQHPLGVLLLCKGKDPLGILFDIFL